MEFGTKEFAEARQLFNQGMYEQSLEKFKTALWYFEEIKDEDQIYQVKERIRRLERYLKGRKTTKDQEPVEVIPEKPSTIEEKSEPFSELEEEDETDIFIVEPPKLDGNLIVLEPSEETVLVREKTNIGYTAYATGEVYERGGFFQRILLTNKRIFLVWLENKKLRWREASLESIESIDIKSNKTLMIEGKFIDDKTKKPYHGVVSLKFKDLLECYKWKRTIFLNQEKLITDKVKRAQWEESIEFEDWKKELFEKDWFGFRDEEKIEHLSESQKERIKKVKKLVEGYIKDGLLMDNRLIRAFYDIPIEDFIPKKYLDKRRIYEDNRSVLFYESAKENRTISAPNMIIEMLQNLALNPTDDLLILGSKSGYIAALASRLCPLGEIFILEANHEIYEFTKMNVRDYRKISIFHQNPLDGMPETAPWQKILITGQIEEIPASLLNQLDEKGGIVFAPIGYPPPKSQVYKQIIRKNDDFHEEDLLRVVFGPLETIKTGPGFVSVEPPKEAPHHLEKVESKLKKISGEFLESIKEFWERPEEVQIPEIRKWSDQEIIDETIRRAKEYEGRIPLILISNELNLNLERVSNALGRCEEGIIETYGTKFLHDDTFVLMEKIPAKSKMINIALSNFTAILENARKLQTLTHTAKVIALHDKMKNYLKDLIVYERTLNLGILKRLISKINESMACCEMLDENLDATERFEFVKKKLGILEEISDYVEDERKRLVELKKYSEKPITPKVIITSEGKEFEEFSEYEYSLSIIGTTDRNLVILRGDSGQIENGEYKEENPADRDLETTFSKKLDGIAKDINDIYRSSNDPSINGDLFKRDEVLNILKELGRNFYSMSLSNKLATIISKLKPGIMHLEISQNLLYLPWELLFDENNFLTLKFDVGRKLPIDTRQLEDITLPIRILLIGDPTKNLPEAKNEVLTIKQALDSFGRDKVVSECWIGEEVDITKYRVLNALHSGDYHVVHYAGHGYYDEISPERSAWRLQDGLVTAIQLTKQMTQKPPLIVFSNACETGKSKGWRGNEFEGQTFGIPNAFLEGGVPIFIGAYWEIHDEAAANLAINFYKRFVSGEKLGNALRNAKRDIYLESDGRELVWASFLLYGDPAIRINLKE